MDKPSHDVPLMIFALDSANLDLVRRWVGEGKLPNLQKLMSGGLTAEVRGPGIFDEIGSWTSAYSGISQFEHQFYSSRRLKPASYDIEICTFEQSNATPFWKYASDSGLRCAVLDPPEPQLLDGMNGYQLAEFNMHVEQYSRFGARSNPTGLVDSIISEMQGNPQLQHDRFEEDRHYYIQALQACLDRMQRRCRAFRQQLKNEPCDVMIIGFGELHDDAHLLWSLSPEVTGVTPGNDRLDHCLEELYRAVDREIGLFLQECEQPTHVLVLATYGIKPQYPVAELGEQLLQNLGLNVSRTGNQQPLTLFGLARRLLPQTVRHQLSKWLPFESQQKALRDRLVNGTDWDKTRAFNIPSLFQNWLRVNLQGREPEGIVTPDDYTALLDELEQQFRQITDPDSGEALVGGIIRPAEHQGIDPLHSMLPDLVVHWKARESLIRQANHPSGRLTQPVPGFNRSTFHDLPGFVIWNGPHSPRGKVLDRVGVLDIAPSCMDMLGLKHPKHWQGVSFAKSESSDRQLQ